jgi:hypothetical protein
MSGTGQGRPRATRLWLDALGATLVALYVIEFVAKNVRLQWDFRVYRAAAQTALHGLDPYLVENLRAVAQRPIELPFVYPAVALLLFLPLAALPSAAALWVWIGFKTAILVALVWVWRQWFLRSTNALALVLVAVFGFNAAALWDLRSGNVALIEIGLLWVGLTAYVRGHRTVFGVLIVVAAVFKLLPIAFLALLLVPAPPERLRPAQLAALLIGFVALIVGPTLVGPSANWRGFASNVSAAIPQGDANPGALALALEVVPHTSGDPDGSWPMAIAIWTAYVLTLLAISLPWLRRAWRAQDPVTWAMGSTMLFVLLSPRPMAYGYVLVVPAAFHFAGRWARGRILSLLVALALSAQGLARVAGYPPSGTIAYHAPFLMALLLWVAEALRAPEPGGEKSTSA